MRRVSVRRPSTSGGTTTRLSSVRRNEMLARMNSVVPSRKMFRMSDTIDAVTMPLAWSVSLMSAVTSRPVRVRWKKPRSSRRRWS